MPISITRHSSPPPWRLPGRGSAYLHNLFSGRCRFCHARSLSRGLCPGCCEDLPWISAACRRCGLPLASGAAECAGCLADPPPFDRARVLWTYGDGVDELIRAFKLREDLAAGRLLTELAAEALCERGVACHGPLVPIPLHTARYRQRGFNQSALIARWLGAAVMESLVFRHRHTPPQRGRSAADRRAALHGAFRLQRPPPRSVTLVDDVVTTGASLAAVAECLREGGVERVEVIALARAI
ncbi:ComF family protein [Spiribacter vilamensis]|uniref:ComF family protein n=1 Tax=Spiribacter vilamensis TaxID=531306 RepID=A0A4Q8D1U8_9GAMM|nr:ComF family protein [Spiribacter vilamensis]RZU99247.1 ComF family protein [Spiribacter vilamensis]TVO61766.1 ComF family protein [Spiribacter vilamensis]